MKKRFKSAKHLNFVRSLDCGVRDISCNGYTEAHHLMKPWIDGRGMGMKATDKNVIPLCQFHHRQLHTKYGNEFKFFMQHFRREDYGQALAKKLYEESFGNSDV